VSESPRPGPELSGALERLSARIERIAMDPSPPRALLVRLMGPLLRAVGSRPGFGLSRVQALLAELQTPAGALRDTPLDRLAAEAVEELERNVAGVEQIASTAGRAPIAHAAWLRRLHGVVASAVSAASAPEDALEKRVGRALDPVFLLAPLRPLAGAREGGDDKERPKTHAPKRPIEIELSAIDIVLDLARGESAFLSRKRRLFEAARQLLLAAGAALPLAADAIEARRKHIAEGIVRIDRLEAAGISPDVSLLHQAKAALARGEVDKLYTALIALDGQALGALDGAVGRRTGAAIDRLRRYAGALDPASDQARAASLSRSSRELFGERVIETVEEAYAEARVSVKLEDEHMDKLARSYFKEGGERASFAGMAASDGWIEVGGGLSPVKITELVPEVRTVAFPTPELTLRPVEDVSDLPNAVIEHPALLLLALAEGTLLSRKYVLRQNVPRARTVRTGEVRVYVLDGSGSMLLFGSGGARARMRDAIMVAELATLARRLRDRRAHRAVLFYRYFDTVVGPITRVASPEEAHAAMRDVICQVRTGGTDIERALIASFAQVQEAKDLDPELARGQVVLITDGDASVREERIEAARKAAGIPVGLSVIALGMENLALRQLVARQRAAGERAFYHFMSDDQLLAIVTGHVDRGPALHLVRADSEPSPSPATSVANRVKELEALLGDLLDELAAIEQKRHAALVDAETDRHAHEGSTRAALSELGVEAAPPDEGALARREAIDRDFRGLELRFSRWFPEPGEPGGALPAEGSPDRADLEAVLVVLETVAEIVELVGGSSFARRADAIDMVERLLPDATLSPGRYQAVLQAFAGVVADRLRAVHAVVKEP
jgi:hypothetical protein